MTTLASLALETLRTAYSLNSHENLLPKTRPIRRPGSHC